MRLLLKHLLRSIARRPLQPIFITLTLAMSLFASTFAFTLDESLRKEADAEQAAGYGCADITVELSGSSESRFMFAAEAEALLGGGSAAEGCYELPLALSGGDTALGVAADFRGIGRIFKLEFTEYGKVTTASLSDSAFVSRDFAQRMGIGVGDEITAQLMGATKTYTVEGITRAPLIGNHDVLVDISGVVRLMSGSSAVFGALNEGFIPSSTVFIHLGEGVESRAEAAGSDAIEYAIELLCADAAFADKSFADVRTIAADRGGTMWLDPIITVIIALSCLLSAVITLSCFYILSAQRSEENLAISYAGAAPRLLAAMQYSEALIYFLGGALLGVAMGFLLMPPAMSCISFRYSTVELTAAAILKSVGILFLVVMLTVSYFLIRGKRARKTGRSPSPSFKPALAALAILAVCALLLFTLPPSVRFELCIVALGALIALIFLTVSPAIGLSSSLLGRLNASAGGSRAAVKYAFKNLASVRMLHNVARISALAVTVILTIALIISGSSNVIEIAATAFDADYVVMNATDRAYSAVKDCESAESVCRMYFDSATSQRILSTDDISILSDRLALERAPEGEEAVVAEGFATMHSLDIGDSFKLNTAGQTIELKVADIARTGFFFVAFDCEHFGIPYNMLAVRAADGVSDAELLSELSALTSSELAAVISSDSMLEPLVRSTTTYLDATRLLITLFSVFAALGGANVLSDTMRSRREEFELYALGGMSPRQIRRMKLCEVLSALGIGALIGIVMLTPSILFTNEGMSEYGYELIINIFG